MRLALFALVVAGCGSSGPPEPKAGCNPLIGDDCLTPWPSSFYQTATGQVSVPAGVLPAPRNTVLTPDRLNAHDGFSPSTPFVVYFKDGVDASQLPTADALDQSVVASSAVQILNFATGERVPVFAELDANATGNQRQALLIHPMARLQPATRYVIALVGLNDTAGKPLAPEGFVALRDKTALNDALKPLASSYEDIFAMLATAGVTRSSLTLAWDITTASDADATSHLMAMRDTALAMVDQLTWTITTQTDTGSDAERVREIVGTFQVPSFLSDDSLTGTLLTDSTGAPMLRDGLGSANFVIEIPACATNATSPLPVMVYGHGLFGDAQSELDTSYQRQLGQYLCMVQIGTNWIGLSQADLPTIAGTVFPDFNQMHIITDRLQQAHVNAQVLTRLVLQRMKDDPALSLNGTPVIDGSTAYYFGISDGGIQGGTYMALAEDVTRGALNVPGAEWSLLMFRSFDFAQLVALLDDTLPDPLEQQILITLFQPDFDYTDPATFAPHIAAPKQVLVQEGIGDSQVTNLATRVLARELNLPGLDLEQQVYGITAGTAPLASAYTQYDIMATPQPPGTDSPPSADDGVHETIRELVPVESQLKSFLAPDGMVIDVCNGAPCTCDFAGGTCAIAPGV
ncbi:MAG TPA: hypothetical protein VGL61_03570 [Kofleriaceae bacterium]|jgi:hypothetical protein